MKIAYLNTSISRRNGGVSEVARRLAQEVAILNEGGVEVLGTQDSASEDDRASWEPLKPRLFAPRYPRSFGYSPEYAQELDLLAPDLCHVHGLWTCPSLLARWAQRRKNRPYIISVHGMLDAWAIRNSRWKKRAAALLFQRAALKNAACLQAMTLAEVRSIRAYGLKNPICLIPNGVDLPQPVTTHPPLWNANGRKSLLYLGRIHPKKGLMPLLAGWARANAEWNLVIAGWDQDGHESDLKQRVSELGITDTVHFIGPQFGQARTAAYQTADAFVLPSFSEGLPLVVLEAWASGLPVLMTPECNLPRGFETGAAIQIAADASGALMELFAMADSRRQAMGARGRALAEEEYSWPKVARAMVDVYSWILGSGTRPPFIH